MKDFNEGVAADVGALHEQESVIFALDIGTRSVIGVVGQQRGDMFQVMDVEYVEHTTRAMVDGQIENIAEVSRVAGRVHAALQERTGIALNRVSVAAAGRALKTQRVTYQTSLASNLPITDPVLSAIELSAIDLAYQNVAKEQIEMEFCCVGHSVIRYYLDDYPISTLLGHKGKEAKVEIIATFLPNEVVDSLYAAMEGIGLQIESLTLEPIAAINAVIPKELRMLNLALVDIGAGTSDIALSKDGSVIAYTMATIAGDEITEALIQQFLVDFQTAENMKVELSNAEASLQFRDILGFEYTVAKSEVLEKIQPACEHLSEEISDKILGINGTAPAAVFLVGGGSKLPQLCSSVAGKLGLDSKKIVVGGNNYIKRIATSTTDISGPEFVTPLGIAISAVNQKDGFALTVNGKKVRLFKNQNVTVMDVLLMSGYKNSQLLGRAGKSVTFELDGVKKTVRGGHPTICQIALNGTAAGLSSEVKPGDSVALVPALNGEDATPTLQEILRDFPRTNVTLNDMPYPLQSTALVNGEEAEPNQPIREADRVETLARESLTQLLARLEIDASSHHIFLNGEICGVDAVLHPGDSVRYIPMVQSRTLPQTPLVQGVGQTVKVAPQVQAGLVHIFLNDMPLTLPAKADGTTYLFVDMLNYVEIDPSKPQGDIVLHLNGREASYIESVVDGDRVDIYWKKDF